MAWYFWLFRHLFEPWLQINTKACVMKHFSIYNHKNSEDQRSLVTFELKIQEELEEINFTLIHKRINPTVDKDLQILSDFSPCIFGSFFVHVTKKNDCGNRESICYFYTLFHTDIHSFMTETPNKWSKINISSGISKNGISFQ